MQALTTPILETKNEERKKEEKKKLSQSMYQSPMRRNQHNRTKSNPILGKYAAKVSSKNKVAPSEKLKAPSPKPTGAQSTKPSKLAQERDKHKGKVMRVEELLRFEK